MLTHYGNRLLKKKLDFNEACVTFRSLPTCFSQSTFCSAGAENQKFYSSYKHRTPLERKSEELRVSIFDLIITAFFGSLS